MVVGQYLAALILCGSPGFPFLVSRFQPALAGAIQFGKPETGNRKLAGQEDEFSELCQKYEDAFRDIKGWEAEWAVERTSKYEDSAFSSRGRIWGKPGAVSTEEGEGKPIRTLIEGTQATRLVTKDRRAEICELDRYCFAAAFLRDGVTEKLRETWDLSIASRPEANPMPELRTKNPDEKPPTPEVVLPGGKPRANALTDVEAEEGKYFVLELRPKKEPLQAAVTSVRLSLHKDTGRIEKIAIDDAMEYAVYRVSGWKALEKVDEERFRLDLSNVEKVVR